jgi:hypothetical protein
VPAATIFDAATVDALLVLAGTHPFKLQRTTHHRYELKACDRSCGFVDSMVE